MTLLLTDFSGLSIGIIIALLPTLKINNSSFIASFWIFLNKSGPGLDSLLYFEASSMTSIEISLLRFVAGKYDGLLIFVLLLVNWKFSGKLALLEFAGTCQNILNVGKCKYFFAAYTVITHLSWKNAPVECHLSIIIFSIPPWNKIFLKIGLVRPIAWSDRIVL